ncbi:AAA family ATPase [Allocatelliglobosispora scoriae]|uniref:AAA family ATPase n=1 Tax=Allocatelliglobosispora scoriae TaxID=643052 RepID=UPI0016097820
MLLSFRFANHRSFRDEQHLNLTPVYPGDLEGSEPRGAVSVAGIFGANASGKSNSLHALAMMKSLVLGSDREVEPDVFKFRRFPFRLDVASEDEPSRYVVDMRVGTSRYSYGFTVNSKCVLEEWLFEWPANTNRKNLIYERVGQKFEWGDRTKRMLTSLKLLI